MSAKYSMKTETFERNVSAAQRVKQGQAVRTQTGKGVGTCAGAREERSQAMMSMCLTLMPTTLLVTRK